MPGKRPNDSQQGGKPEKKEQDAGSNEPRTRTGGQTDSGTGSKPGGGGPSQGEKK